MDRGVFEFRQFSIAHDQCGMPVSTDGILIAAWTKLSQPRNILDVGTGSGLLALILAQRTAATPEVQLVGIEVDPHSARQALSNVSRSPWPTRVMIRETSLQNFVENTSQRFDLIVCNPPFFVGSSPARAEGRKLARHADQLGPSDFWGGIRLIRAPQAMVCMILPNNPKLLEAHAEQSRRNGFMISRKTLVRSLPHKEPRRALIEFVSSEKSPEPKTEELVIEDRPGCYSSHYQRLTEAFYLPKAFLPKFH